MSKLKDKWQSRDFPTLIATVELLEDGSPVVQAHQISEQTGLSVEDAIKARVPGTALTSYETG